MHRQPLRTLPVVLFPLVATMFGCGEDEPVALADESTETGDLDESDDTTAPTVDIMIEGDVHTLRSATQLHVQADARDASGIEVVEFYLDDELLSSDALEPYTANVMIADASFNGERSLTARAWDSNGNMAESAIPLSVALPESGTVDWEYIGAGPGPRWVFVGPEDSAVTVGEREMLRISSEGELLSKYEFTYDVSAATMNEDGDVIALGALDGTLAITRISSDGVPFLDLIDNFGHFDFSITDVALDDGRLVIATVDLNTAWFVNTARVSTVSYPDDVAVQWQHDLTRELQPTNLDRPSRLTVAPSGAIYTTATFEAGSNHVFLQLRRIETDAQMGPISEYLVDAQSSYDDVVATEHSVFVAGRLNNLGVVERFASYAVPNALLYTDAAVATLLEPAGNEFIFTAVMPDNSTKIGRLSADGAERWSKPVGFDVVHDIAVTSVGHIYAVSEWDEAAWRLRRIHP